MRRPRPRRKSRPRSARRRRAARRARRNRRACGTAPASRADLRGFGVGAGAALGARDDAPQHVDEQAGDRQVRPGRVGGDMEQHDEPLAARARRSPAACRRRAAPRSSPSGPGSGSASTWRVTVTSSGAARPTNGLGSSNGAMCLGVSQDSAPPSVRPPRRNAVGVRSSSPAASRVPAKRISTPPSSTNSASASWVGPGATLMSASASAEGFSASNDAIGSAAPGAASRISANGYSARFM